MSDWLELWNKYGFWALLGVLVLTNAGKIAAATGKLVDRIWPTWAEARRLRREQERERETREHKAGEAERLDTILALKDMLLAYRQSLDDAHLERRQLQNRLYDLVERYERHDARFIEVLRDVSEVVRAQTERINHLAMALREGDGKVSIVS